MAAVNNQVIIVNWYMKDHIFELQKSTIIVKIWLIITVMHTTFKSNCEIKAWKKKKRPEHFVSL